MMENEPPAGPTVPDYSGPAAPMSSSDTGNPNPLLLVADAQGVFSYTFASKLPDTAAGTWAVTLEGRRSATTDRASTCVLSPAAPRSRCAWCWPDWLAN